jgi:ABC-type transporter Mla maintaining outer membrane lipid asymmetry ATPase subunit MlaF
MNTISQPEAAPALIRFRDVQIASTPGVIDCGDWEVAPGEAWFVAGGVAAGKTALVRSLAGLEPVRSGRIERFGTDWAAISESETLRQRRRLGVVLAREAGLFHQLTVLENLRLPLRYHGGGTREEEEEERLGQLLRAFEIEKQAHLASTRISPSMARRVLLARALALRPELLLLDDPCAGLDDWDRRWLIHFVARLHAGHELNQGEPLPLIITGHSPADWRSFPNLRWAFLRAGVLGVANRWEQLVASAPELFHAGEVEPSPD